MKTPILLSLFFLGAAAHCGDLQPGFSECGDQPCQPGQYCLNAKEGVCFAGCTSDLNCAGDMTCGGYTVDRVGTCEAPSAAPALAGSNSAQVPTNP